MKSFLAKNSFYITTAVGVCLLIYLVLRWSDLAVMQRLVCFFFIALVAHEWEEKLFGFEELSANHLGVSTEEIQKGVGYIALFFVTMYLGLVPLALPHIVWLSASFMVLGLIEVFGHLATIRMNKSGRVYSGGMVTAFTLLPLISVYGFYYLISNGLMEPIHWLFAFMNLVIPLFCAQIIAVKSVGVKYGDFMRNVRASMKHA